MSFLNLIVIVLFVFSLVGCTAIPPMDNPQFSFGRKCNDNGHWSYVWIHDADTELSATEEKCK